MGLLVRLFSPDYRRAQTAEAAGDLEEAARAYSLCGEHERAALVHLTRAERAEGTDARIEALRAVLRHAEPGGATAEAARRLLARTLLDRARAEGVTNDTDRSLLREAARLFELASDPGSAGEALLLLDEEEHAMAAFTRAGQVDRVEALLAEKAASEEIERALYQAAADHRAQLATGQRSAALAALRRCVEACTRADRQAASATGAVRRTLVGIAAQRAANERLAEELAARRLDGGWADVRVAGETVRLCGASPARLGRDPSCELPLRDPDLSRRHAEIVWRDGFFVRDAGSRNGTRLGGIPLAAGAEVALAAGGCLELGDTQELWVSLRGSEPPACVLAIARGMDRGRRLVVGHGAVALELAFPALEGARVCFESGVPLLVPPTGERIELEGRPLATPVELIHGDRLRVRGHDLEIP